VWVGSVYSDELASRTLVGGPRGAGNYVTSEI